MKAEITFDLVMVEDMAFVEGCYRLENGDWQVFVFRKSRRGTEPVGVKKDLVWRSGVKGINIIVADDARINKSFVLKSLSDALGGIEWTEVSGPDSMQLR
jgi:hypothetical protein